MNCPNPNRVRRRRGDDAFRIQGHDELFRRRNPNPSMRWVLVLDGRVLARSSSAERLVKNQADMGGEIREER